MDYIAFEAMEIIKNHPVTRFPSLHLAYALFKEHEETIVDGCKVIKAKEDMGICVVNPSGDLDKMEKRMKLFMDFWLPQWKSCYNVQPSEEMFEDALINRDILMYKNLIFLLTLSLICLLFVRIFFLFFFLGILVMEME